VTVLFVDIGGIVELYCLRFLFTIDRLNIIRKLQRCKSLREIQKHTTVPELIKI